MPWRLAPARCSRCSATAGEQINNALGERTESLQVVFEEYTRALDSSMANRAEALDMALVERTQALDDAFTERLKVFDESIIRSTLAIDNTLGERATALSAAMEHHAKNIGETLGRQALELDENLLQGINAVRRTSENITRQSIKAIEGLAGQSELLKNVSENLLSQINSITNRFENQGQQIMRAANSLETVNYKIDKTLQTRHAELSHTLDRMAGKADELGNVVTGYSARLEGTMTEAERRARALTSELTQGAEERSRMTIAEIERLRNSANDTTTRALEDMRSRFSNVSQEMSESMSSISSQFSETSTDARRRTAAAAAELATEQDRLRAQIQNLPGTAREGAEALRKSLHDQLRALDELSSLRQREAMTRDVSRPLAAQQPRRLVPIATSPATREEQANALSTLSSALSQEIHSRARLQPQPPAPSPAPPAAAGRLVDGRPLEARIGRRGTRRARAGTGACAGRGTSTGRRAPANSGFDMAAAARALDPATAADLWQRLGAGQQGIMVRSIYTPEGRGLFDELVQRWSVEPSFQAVVMQFLADFERVLQEADRIDPSGNTARGHLTADYGRIYLLLAHASGRIS